MWGGARRRAQKKTKSPLDPDERSPNETPLVRGSTFVSKGNHRRTTWRCFLSWSTLPNRKVADPKQSNVSQSLKRSNYVEDGRERLTVFWRLDLQGHIPSPSLENIIPKITKKRRNKLNNILHPFPTFLLSFFFYMKSC